MPEINRSVDNTKLSSFSLAFVLEELDLNNLGTCKVLKVQSSILSTITVSACRFSLIYYMPCYKGKKLQTLKTLEFILSFKVQCIL